MKKRFLVMLALGILLVGCSTTGTLGIVTKSSANTPVPF